jgi:hypothetical protein
MTICRPSGYAGILRAVAEVTDPADDILAKVDDGQITFQGSADHDRGKIP